MYMLQTDIQKKNILVKNHKNKLISSSQIPIWKHTYKNHCMDKILFFLSPKSNRFKLKNIAFNDA